MSHEHTQAEQDAILRSKIDKSLRHPVMFFFTSGAVWLVVAILLGIVASVKMVSPKFLGNCEFFSQGRVFAAHLSTLAFGWGCQAAFGVLIWLIARLTRQECRHAGLVLTAGHAWNALIAIGTLFVLGGGGSGVPWMEFPSFIWAGLLLCYVMIAIWSMVQFRVRTPGPVYVTQWYAAAAMIWLPWILVTALVFVFIETGNPLMSAAVASWFHSGMIYLFFVPVAAAAAYYLSPKVTGRPVYSYSLSLLGFWFLAFCAPWAGMQKLAGAPIPYFLPYLGAGATVLLGIPAIAIAVSNLCTIFSDTKKASVSPTLHFTAAGMFCMVILGLAGFFTNVPGNTLPLTQFSITAYGMDILAVYGTFSFVMFGAIYFIVPRISRREWLSKRMIRLHFLLSMYGVIAVVLMAVFGGLLHGQGQENFVSGWDNAVERSFPYFVGTSIAWVFVLLSNFCFCLHLLAMWLRLGRRSSHPTLLDHHHPVSPHGPEGDIDNAGPGSVIAH